MDNGFKDAAHDTETAQGGVRGVVVVVMRTVMVFAVGAYYMTYLWILPGVVGMTVALFTGQEPPSSTVRSLTIVAIAMAVHWILIPHWAYLRYVRRRRPLDEENGHE